MKKIFLLLCLLFAVAVPALATDVTIGALTVSGFSPSSIGNDRSIAVTAANGSPTVTSSGLFTGIVGMSGFQVLIDGTQYAVASVASTSSLTLTTNYSGTPGAQTMTLYKWIEMRVYADRAFQPRGGTQIVQPGTVGSGSFFRRFAASVVNNGSTDQLFLPEIVIPATTDALITNQARYSFPLYRPGGGSQITFFFCPSSISQFALPPATPTTWGAICQFNSPGAVIPPNKEAYTKTEIDARLPSCSQNNGVYYSSSGNILNCLVFGNGLSVVNGTLEASAGGSGYATIQEEGSGLTQRGILNFIGTSATAADDAGNTRTNVSFDTDLNALASNSTNGFWARTGAGTGSARTLTGTANEITVTNGDGSGVPTFSLPSALTFSGKTITGGTYATPTITTPTITGGTHTAITGLGIRSTGSGAFDLTLANTENLTAGRTLTLTLNNAARTLNMGGNITTGGTFSTTGNFSTGGAFTTGSTFSTTGTFATGGNFSTANTFSTTGTFSSGGNFSTGSTFSTTGTFSSGGNFSTGGTFSTTGAFSTAAAFTTSGANALTLTTTGSTNVTLPTTGTLATLAGTETFTNKTLTTPRIGTSLNDTNGNEVIRTPATASAINDITVTNAAIGNAPAITATGDDTNINLRLAGKGTGRLVLPGYPFALDVNTTATGNVGAGLDALHSTTLAADTLAANNDFIEAEFSGTFANNDNNKRVVIQLDGQTLFDSGSQDFDGAADRDGWVLRVTIVRTSATTVNASTAVAIGQFFADGAGTFVSTNGMARGNVAHGVTVSNLDSNSVVLRVLGEATSNDDVVARTSTVKLTQR